MAHDSWQCKQKHAPTVTFTLGISLGGAINFHALMIKVAAEGERASSRTQNEAALPRLSKADTAAGGYIAWITERESAIHWQLVE